MNILELNDVSMSYGSVKALQHISLTVRPGEWISIMGASGSGKTTMMNIVGCMNKATHGSVILDGENISRLNARDLTVIRRDKIGLIFQQFHLISYLTALENVMIAQYYHSMVDEKEATQALERVGLASRAKHLPRQLSGGEQQRLCIARALINYPKLILADEPTGNLDEINQNTVMDIFHQLHKEGSTIIVVTHSPEVAAHGQRVVSLEFGRLVGDASTQQVRA
ncbi:ABC transporter ATP-binding protein [Deltaproteobacteria bacterium]|nr:ABC transporter ATP-binding protein [Deltaproteobacteria bacterium]